MERLPGIFFHPDPLSLPSLLFSTREAANLGNELASHVVSVPRSQHTALILVKFTKLWQQRNSWLLYTPPAYPALPLLGELLQRCCVWVFILIRDVSGEKCAQQATPHLFPSHLRLPPLPKAGFGDSEGSKRILLSQTPTWRQPPLHRVSAGAAGRSPVGKRCSRPLRAPDSGGLHSRP